MKKIKIILIIISVIITLIGINAFADQLLLNVFVNGKKVDFPDAQPFVDENERTLVPVRFVSEALNGTVGWDGDTKTAIITRGTDVVSITIGQKSIKVNGISKELDTAAIIVEERTFVPLRFVSEALGEKVGWNDATNTANIGILEDNAENLTYFRNGDWIYFSNTNYDSSIFKIKVDGSGRERLNYNNCTIFQIEKDWIYYLDNDEENLYKIKIDGNDKTLLGEWNLNFDPKTMVEIWDFNFVAVKNEWVYYTDNLGGLYRVLSLERKEKLGENIEYTIVSNDKIYYEKDNSIYSMNFDGTENQIVVPSGVTSYGSYINWAFDKWLFYKNYDTDELFIVSKDDNIKTKLPIKMFGTDILAIKDDWVYYVLDTLSCYQDPVMLYRIKTDGTQNSEIIKINSTPVIEDNVIYFIDNEKMYKIQLDGTEKEEIINALDATYSYGGLEITEVENGWIYYKSTMYNSIVLYRVKIDGSGKSKLWEAHNNYDGGA